MSRTAHHSSLRCFLWQMTTWHRDRARDRAIITNYTEQFLRDMLLVTHRLSRWCCHNMLWSGVKYLDTIIRTLEYYICGASNTSNQFPLLPMSDNNTWYYKHPPDHDRHHSICQVSLLINLLQPRLSPSSDSGSIFWAFRDNPDISLTSLGAG